MKKCLMLISFVAMAMLLTACGGNKITCTATETEDGITVKQEVVANFDSNDKIKDYKASFDFGNETIATTYCQLYKSLANEEKKLDIDCSGSKIIIKGTPDADSNDEDELIKGSTKEDFKKALEEEGFKCK